MLWLKTEVGLDDKVLEKYESLLELNGLTLFSYGGDDASAALASESRVPMRIAIRILCIRDKIHEKKSNPLLQFTSEQISEFLKEIFVIRDRTYLKMLCEHIIKWNINGLIFYSYKDGKEFQSDFDDLAIDGIYFRKAIIMRNERFNMPTNTCPSFSDEKKEVQKAVNLSESITCTAQHPVQEKFQDPSMELEANKAKKLLCPMLSLDDKRDCKSCKPCVLKIIYGSWTNQNTEFEKKIAFFLLCEEDEFKKKPQQNNLWEEIIHERNRLQWLDHLTEDQRKNFNGRNDIPKNQGKLAYVMDKDLEFINGFDQGILLTTKNIFESNERCFVTNLSNNSSNPQQFIFAFRTSEKYWVFDPENYSNGFERQSVEEGRSGNGETHVQKHRNIRKEGAETEKIRIQYPRKFKADSETVKYQAGSIFNQPECGGEVASRALEFKALFSCIRNKKGNRFIKFVTDTIKFASACLNSRVNGTIYFGVADSVGIIDDKVYKHGEIRGLEITDIDDDTRNAYTEALEHANKSGAFYSEMTDVASRCISGPKFVEVETPDESIRRYVIEVDIEAASEICKKNYFKVNLKKIKNQVESVKDKHVLFLRKGASTVKLEGAAEELFINSTLQDFVSNRKRVDGETKLRICEKCKKQ